MIRCASRWTHYVRLEMTFAHFAGVTTLPENDIDKLLQLGDPSLVTAVAMFGRSDDPKFSDKRVKLTLCIVSLWAKISAARLKSK